MLGRDGYCIKRRNVCMFRFRVEEGCIGGDERYHINHILSGMHVCVPCLFRYVIVSSVLIHANQFHY
jgi:hypothetical protein